MCELFGYNGSCPKEINQELKEFFGHGRLHPHGWGMALYEDMEIAIEKEPVPSYKSVYLKERLRDTISVKTALAHIRYATIGNVERRNCHPFSGVDKSGRRWSLIHNGTIFQFQGMEPFVRCQKGDTDSERILLYLLEQINSRTDEAGHVLTGQERFAVMDRIMVEVSSGNKMNLIVYDGELFYIHTNFANSLYYRQTDYGIYVSTTPLSIGQWEPVPFTTLLAYRNGAPAYTGTNHGQEYFVDEEQMKMLYLAFSSL